MFKKTALIAALFFSCSVYAESSTVAKLYPVQSRVPRNQDLHFMSHHEYAVSNNTAQSQSISMCYDIVVCPEWQYYIKSKRECESFELKAWQTKYGKGDLEIIVNYPFMGWCHIYAETTTTGGTPSKAHDEKQFEVN